MDYPVESFSESERAALAPHFTNLDSPVFALVNLPETVKGAMFARYSRYQGTLRRLYLDEFAQDSRTPAAPAFDGAEGERARKLYERIFLGYGDDSVAQLGGAHVACEWVSNVMTKVLQRGRLAAYLEQSTRYIPYDVPIEGTSAYRYWRDPALGPEYEAAMDSLFYAYSDSLPRVRAWAAERFPRADDEAESAHARSINAKALDLLRGLLPAASLSHVGVFASGQAYEQLILRCLASPLPEARDYGRMILTELKSVMPSFLTRVERPERGGEWISYLEERADAAERWAGRLGLDRTRGGTEDTRAVGEAAVGRGLRGRPARRAAVRGRGGVRAGGAASRARTATRRARADARPSWWASAATAATAPAAAWRRCATASRWCPTTAPSATSSATGCSRSSGRRCRRTSEPACRRSSRRPAWRTTTAQRSSARPPSTPGSWVPARLSWRPTRCAWATASATCWT